jgi:hypothetical protein
MLLVGIIFRNTSPIAAVIGVDKLWGGTIRKLAFVIILLRGGLGLDGKALAKLKVYRLFGFYPRFSRVHVYVSHSCRARWKRSQSLLPRI